MLNILLISIALVCVIDISGFTDSWKSSLKKLITKGRMSDPNYSLKPFDCSLCMTFWVGLFYLIFTGGISIFMITYLLLISVMTPVIKDFILLVRDILLKLLNL